MSLNVYLWLAGAVLFAVIEWISATTADSLWFSVGALAAMLVALFTDSLPGQVLVFVIVSLISVLLLRPLVKKHINPHTTPTNADRLIGCDATVLQTVDNAQASGQVRLQGQVWTARSEDGSVLVPDTPVTVVRLEGVKVIVRPASAAE